MIVCTYECKYMQHLCMYIHLSGLGMIKSVTVIDYTFCVIVIVITLFVIVIMLYNHL